MRFAHLFGRLDVDRVDKKEDNGVLPLSQGALALSCLYLPYSKRKKQVSIGDRPQNRLILPKNKKSG